MTLPVSRDEFVKLLDHPQLRHLSAEREGDKVVISAYCNHQREPLKAILYGQVLDSPEIRAAIKAAKQVVLCRDRDLRDTFSPDGI